MGYGFNVLSEPADRLTKLFSNNSIADRLFNNYTELVDGRYLLNASGNDSAGNRAETETRNITIDATNPNATLLTPANNTFNNTNQNFTVNLTDNYGLSNATLYIYDSLNNLINKTVNCSNCLEKSTSSFSPFIETIFSSISELSG